MPITHHRVRLSLRARNGVSDGLAVIRQRGGKAAANGRDIAGDVTGERSKATYMQEELRLGGIQRRLKWKCCVD